jgi:predicted nucleic acid-binding protein
MIVLDASVVVDLLIKPAAGTELCSDARSPCATS